MQKKFGIKKQLALLRAVEVFDLPGDIISGIARVEVTGGRELLVENHGGIIEFGEELMRINGGTVIIEVRGMSLDITSMTAAELRIRGQIFDINFKY